MLKIDLARPEGALVETFLAERYSVLRYADYCYRLWVMSTNQIEDLGQFAGFEGVAVGNQKFLLRHHDMQRLMVVDLRKKTLKEVRLHRQFRWVDIDEEDSIVFMTHDGLLFDGKGFHAKITKKTCGFAVSKRYVAVSLEDAEDDVCIAVWNRETRCFQGTTAEIRRWSGTMRIQGDSLLICGVYGSLLELDIPTMELLYVSDVHFKKTSVWGAIKFSPEQYAYFSQQALSFQDGNDHPFLVTHEYVLPRRGFVKNIAESQNKLVLITKDEMAHIITKSESFNALRFFI